MGFTSCQGRFDLGLEALDGYPPLDRLRCPTSPPPRGFGDHGQRRELYTDEGQHLKANTAYSIDDAYSVGMEGEVGVALS